MDNKKNTILLTVIAVATLLVAVVGATFAYFTAQGGTTATAQVKVTTGTASNTTFSTFSSINIIADMTNFAKNTGQTQTGSSEGTVTWTAPGKTDNYDPSEADRTMCYTATLGSITNNFQAGSNGAELTLDAKVGTNKVITDMDITTTTTDIPIPTTVGGADYKHKLLAEAGKNAEANWVVTVSFNYLADVDQNYNAGKSFQGTLTFKKVNC